MDPRDIKILFKSAIPSEITMEEAIEMNLIKPDTMRNYLIVLDVYEELQKREITFYNILLGLESKYDLSVRQLARIYNNNRHFLKSFKSV